MSIQDKSVTALVRSMKKSLEADHNVQVPYSALRASYLVAQGQNPHAQAGKGAKFESKVSASTDVKALEVEVSRLQALIERAPVFFAPQYDFEGQKLQWLEEAGLVKKPAVDVPAEPAGVLRTLYLVEDDVGCLTRLALDKDGRYLVPEDFLFSANSVVDSQSALVPSIKRYGLPNYLSNPQGFFGDFGLKLSVGYLASYEDLGDDSGDVCRIEVRIHESDWKRLMSALLEEDESFCGDVEEWVGLHYKQNMSAMPEAKRLDWALRYMEAPSLPESQVYLEWVYPDEDSDKVPARVHLATGVVMPLLRTPDDILDRQVRVRLVSEDWTDVYPLTYFNTEEGGYWKLETKKSLSELRREVLFS